MTNLSKEEKATLEKMAKEMFGCSYSDLDFDEQDMLYCMMEEQY